MSHGSSFKTLGAISIPLSFWCYLIVDCFANLGIAGAAIVALTTVFLPVIVSAGVTPAFLVLALTGITLFGDLRVLVLAGSAPSGFKTWV